MAHPAFVDQDQLMALAKCKHKTRLMRWLQDKQIPYDLNTRGEVWTTIQAINAHLLPQQSGNDDDVEFV